MQDTTFDPVVGGTVPDGVKGVHLCGWTLGPVGVKGILLVRITCGSVLWLRRYCSPKRYCSRGVILQEKLVMIAVVHSRGAKRGNGARFT